MNQSERFWLKVSRGEPDECWEWQGGKTGGGYGSFGFGGQGTTAHRVAWILTNGPIPAGLYVLHHCDNPSCVNPAHLFIGSQADNHRDRIQKGRGNEGERNNLSKVTRADVREIRRLKANGIKQTLLARMFRLTEASISHIVNRKNWTHI